MLTSSKSHATLIPILVFLVRFYVVFMGSFIAMTSVSVFMRGGEGGGFLAPSGYLMSKKPSQVKVKG